ncbi:TspO/MBR family protein [Undibacterium sp. RTI2.1]|uniref:TspO/MBR family protein n=1 Tax=unclassified Undibacterium TaxID=2630295 RepID=UPI002AB3C955|nr:MULTISPECIES: TspO/MBR family protein [unclassified Undibacterium]MDY7539580.1 TspO/MBR family protein [Undibacterium sp. 5I1]MEB0030117.1 TspO/MBR family protein [Undibacterium sp. RTI2.1]MEB0116645.1 TspO/MBR family protein [Undibacterium sp. RTI2.2]MEB0230470.1 TspO/MBR family protein [Undibacterium sp. 10I3]MEB0258468.1 TspO/MBR family protein [Undibacterium sp. 5I1]
MQKTNSLYPLSTQITGFIGWFIITFAAAAIGAFASAQAGAFYTQLVRPVWAPPAWLFGPVWTLLYLMMAIAVWLVWRAYGLQRAGAALGIFVVQLTANALWTWLFFVWHQGALAFVEILLLWVLIAGTIIAFWRLHKVAALLLLPYLAWVSFACGLTYSTWTLNPSILG